MARSILPRAITALGSLLLAHMASAQAAAGPDGRAAAPANELAEVLVTAQRRTEDIQKAALSIEVFGGDDLRAAGVSKADDLTKLAPGLQISGGTTTQVYVRGVGDFGVTATANPAVATSVDGVAIARPQAISGNFFDLERVELLKGPQGTLYGRNASGGALNILSAQPVLGEFAGFAQATLGSYSLRALEGAFNLPAGQRSAFRLSYQVNSREGYLSDGTDDDKHQSFRLQNKFQDGALTLRTVLSYGHLGGRGTGVAIIPALTGLSAWTGNTDSRAGAAFMAAATAQFNGALAGGCNPAPPPAGNCPPAPALLSNPATSATFQDVTTYAGHLQLDYDFGGPVLTVIPAYRRTDGRFAIQPSFLYNVGGVYGPNGEKSNGETSRQTSLEARLAGNTDRVKWVLGAYWFKEDQTNDFALQGGQILNQRVIGALGTTAIAGFGQLTYNVTERFRVTGGLRYTSDERTSDSLSKFAISPSITSPLFAIAGLPPIPCLPNVPAAGANPPGALCRLMNANPDFYDSKVKFNKATWKAGIEVDLRDASMLYADISTGFKAGGFNQALSIADPSKLQAYEPESITAYTVGLKNRFLDNRLQLNLETFYWDYKDLQLSAQGIDAAGLIVLLTQNAGKATVKGQNVSVVAKPWTNGTLRASVEYVDSNYDNFVLTQLAQFAPPGRTSCSQAYSPTGTVTVNCSGFPLVRSPKWSGNLGLSHDIPLGNGGKVALDADVSFSGSYYLATDFRPKQQDDGYNNVSASVTYHAPDDRWFISAYGRNLSNEAIYTGGGGHQSGFVQGWFTSNIAPPRTYGARLGVRF